MPICTVHAPGTSRATSACAAAIRSPSGPPRCAMTVVPFRATPSAASGTPSSATTTLATRTRRRRRQGVGQRRGGQVGRLPRGGGRAQPGLDPARHRRLRQHDQHAFHTSIIGTDPRRRQWSAPYRLMTSAEVRGSTIAGVKSQISRKRCFPPMRSRQGEHGPDACMVDDRLGVDGSRPDPRRRPCRGVTAPARRRGDRARTNCGLNGRGMPDITDGYDERQKPPARYTLRGLTGPRSRT